MSQSTRLVFNTVILFGRMGLTFGLGLYTTRLVVDLLGHSDYGLMATIGATGTMLYVLSRALNTSAQRHLAHEIGTGNDERLRQVFNTTLALFVGVGLAVCAVGAAVAGPLVASLNIPEGREGAAHLALLLTIANLATVAAATPFRAVVEARQAMGQAAIFEAARSLLHLAAALVLTLLEGDRLIAWASLLLTGDMARALVNAGVCALRFPEARPHPRHFRRSELARVTGFAGWATLVRVSQVVHNQAAIVLLSLAFTPVVTAAYAIACQLGQYLAHVAKVLPRVVQPAMTSMHARGDLGKVQALALLSGKYGGLGVSFLVVPLLLEMDGVLDLWLHSFPPQTPLLARLTLVWMLVHVLSGGFDRAAYAHGDLARYASLTTATWLLSLLLAGVGFHAFGLGPSTMPVSILLAVLCQIPIRIGYVGRLIGVGYGRWLRETVWPVAAPLVPGLAAACAVHGTLADGWLRFPAVALGFAVGAVPVVWLVSVSRHEKRIFHRVAGSTLAGLQRRLAA